ncbi:MAG: hypothetical protein ACLRWQ_22000 [Flavonifractor plautii]
MDFSADLFNCPARCPGPGPDLGHYGHRRLHHLLKSWTWPDLTVDGTMCHRRRRGALMHAPWAGTAWVALLAAFLAGMLAGAAITGLLHTAMRHPRHPGRDPVTQLALYSINLRIMAVGAPAMHHQGHPGGERGQVSPCCCPLPLRAGPVGGQPLLLLGALVLTAAVIQRCCTGSSARSWAPPCGPPAPIRAWPGPRASTRCCSVLSCFPINASNT